MDCRRRRRWCPHRNHNERPRAPEIAVGVAVGAHVGFVLGRTKPKPEKYRLSTGCTASHPQRHRLRADNRGQVQTDRDSTDADGLSRPYPRSRCRHPNRVRRRHDPAGRVLEPANAGRKPRGAGESCLSPSRSVPPPLAWECAARRSAVARRSAAARHAAARCAAFSRAFRGASRSRVSRGSRSAGQPSLRQPFPCRRCAVPCRSPATRPNWNW